VLAFHSELKYRHLDERINNGDDAAISRRNLVQVLFAAIISKFRQQFCFVLLQNLFIL